MANDNDTYTSNGLNQYTDIDGAFPVYDGNGNITTDHNGRGLEYDAENMLAVVRDAPAGTALLSVSSWADGTMRLADAGGTVSRYYYDGDQEIAETDDAGGVDLADNQILWRYLRMPGSMDEVLKVISYNANGTIAWQKFAHADRLGSVRRLSWASSGNPSGSDVYQYSPYGESGPEGDTGFAFRFTGQKLFSSVGLYYYKARWYDPETGRFLQTDPIGYEDQMNLYAYVGNDPLNAYDPSGQCSTGSRLGENTGCKIDFSSFAQMFNEVVKQRHLFRGNQVSTQTSNDERNSGSKRSSEDDEAMARLGPIRVIRGVPYRAPLAPRAVPRVTEQTRPPTSAAQAKRAFRWGQAEKGADAALRRFDSDKDPFEAIEQGMTRLDAIKWRNFYATQNKRNPQPQFRKRQELLERYIRYWPEEVIV